MKKAKFYIGTIPAIIWGEPSERIFIHVHGKMSRKEYAESFAAIVQEHGYNTMSFDLAQHGERMTAVVVTCGAVWLTLSRYMTM